MESQSGESASRPERCVGFDDFEFAKTDPFRAYDTYGVLKNTLERVDCPRAKPSMVAKILDHYIDRLLFGIPYPENPKLMNGEAVGFGTEVEAGRAEAESFEKWILTGALVPFVQLMEEELDTFSVAKGFEDVRQEYLVRNRLAKNNSNDDPS